MPATQPSATHVSVQRHRDGGQLRVLELDECVAPVTVQVDVGHRLAAWQPVLRVLRDDGAVEQLPQSHVRDLWGVKGWGRTQGVRGGACKEGGGAWQV